MIQRVTQWMCWGLLFGVAGILGGCEMSPLASLEEMIDTTPISTPDQGGSDGEEGDRPVPPPAVGETPASGDGEGGDGAEPGADGDDDIPSDEGDQEEPETPTIDDSPPVAQYQVLGTPVNTALPITLAATDADDADLEYAVVAGPAHGRLDGEPPNLTYVPADNYVGFDSLSFQADSGRPEGLSNVANVRIWVIDEQDLSGQSVSGTIDPASDVEAWSFQGAIDQRVVISVAATSGHLWPVLSLYPPGGAGAEDSTAYERIDRQLGTTGQYTITVESHRPYPSPGDYSLTLLNLDGQLASLADLDGGPVASGDNLHGSVNTPPDIDAFTFEAVAGQRVVINVARTSGHLWPVLSLYPPGGGGAEESTAGGRIDRQLLTSGRYTVTVESHRPYPSTGDYGLSLQQF